MARKRPRVTEFDKIGDKPVASANVRCVVTSLSPVKKGRKSKYFHGNASDGSTTRRLLSFSESHLEVLKKFKGGRETVELKDCQLKRGNRGEEMEIVIKSGTEIVPCATKIDTTNITFDDGVAPEVPVAILPKKCIFDQMTIRAKVQKVSKQESIENSGVKQDIVISDSSSIGRVTVWGSYVGTLVEGTCYLFSNFMVN